MARAGQKHDTFQSGYMTFTATWDDQVAARPPELVQAAMTTLSHDLLDRANRVAPRRTGRLIDSSRVAIDRSGLTWRLQYPQPYARRQHYQHPTGGRPGPGRRTIRRFSRASGIPSRKLWLMTTVRDEMDDADRRIAALIGRASSLI